jgi:hypothetical protein
MLETKKLLNESEEIKLRLISIELKVIGKEKPMKGDRKAVKFALNEYKKGKTVLYNF